MAPNEKRAADWGSTFAGCAGKSGAMMDISDFLGIAMIASFAVGLSKGGLPSVGALAVPLMALYVDPLTAAAMLLPIYIVSDAYGMWLYRHAFSGRNLAILLPAGLAGVLIGYLAAPVLSVPVINLIVGAIGIFYCLRQWLALGRTTVPRPARVLPGLFWGTVAGITSFVSHAGAPPYQVYVLPQKLPKLVFAGTSTITFAVINLAKLPPYLALGQFPDFAPLPTTILIIAAIAGAWLGAHLTRIIPERPFFLAVQIALFAISARLIWKALAVLSA